MTAVPLQIEKDALFQFLDEGDDGFYTFREQLRGGKLILLSQRTGRKKPISTSDFEDLINDEKVIRVSGTDPREAGKRIETALFASLDPNNPKLTAAERKRAENAAAKWMASETLVFYLKKWVLRPDVPISRIPVEKFVREYKDEAEELGLLWQPSFSALRRAREKSSGTVTIKNLVAIYGTHDENKRHQPFVVQLKKELIECFWSEAAPAEVDAIAQYMVAFDKEKIRREAAGLSCPTCVAYSTLQRWIKQAKNYENFKARYGVRSANRAFKGRGTAVSSDIPLEYLIFDHTRVDAWAKYVDEDGQEHWERPWLVAAVDVCSSAIVGGVLTFEPPSLLSIMACLKQVVRKKKFLINRYGEYKGATDCFGKPGTVIVDNAWEGTGKSFKIALHAAGMDIEWAPRKTPEYKTFCERVFGTFNTSLWHKLQAGIPFKPGHRNESRPEPQDMPKFSIEELTDRFWDLVVTRLHVEVCDRIHMAPARKWALGLKAHGRQLLDNIGDLDRIFGGTDTATLTAEGVLHDGFRFHHKDDVTLTLDSLLRYSPERFQRAADNSTGKVRVQLTKDPADCSRIDIWDYGRKKFVRLYNTDARFSAGLDWKVAKSIKKWADAENQAFHSDGEKYAARVAFNKTLSIDAKKTPFRQARKIVRQLHSEHRLIPGVTVEEAVAEPSVSGMNCVDIPQVFAGSKWSGNHIPSKGKKRGGSTAAARSQTPKSDSVPASVQVVSETRDPAPRRGLRSETYEGFHVQRSSTRVQDPADMMAAFEKEVRERGMQP